MPNWSYSFVASGNGTFNGSGTVTTAGTALFGLQPLFFGGNGFGDVGGTVFDPAGSDSFAFALVSGQAYTITLANNGNISSTSGLSGGSGSASGVVDWRITYLSAPVPEPGAWAMMILGFGFVGGVVRRGRVANRRNAFALDRL